MWQAAIAHARTCYGAQDGCAWVQLEEQMQMARAEDERFWQNALKIQSTAVVLVYFREQERIEQSITMT